MKNLMDLSGRVALVTGAGRGIGREIARVLASAGADIIVAEYNLETGKDAVEEIKGMGRKSYLFEVNVADSASVKALAEQVYQQLEAVDILVNNAGVSGNMLAEETPDEEWKRVMGINLDGVFWCCREFGSRMLERGKGSIVNIASMSGHIVNDPQPQTPYNVSKAAVIMLTKSLGVEWAKKGVRVNSVSPGYIATDLVKGVLDLNPVWKERWTSMTPVGHLGETTDVAHAVWYLASDAAKFATGTDLLVDGGYTSW
ncbi:MAG: glucose 1-dehydrogenase [Trueperaceae bacterium]|nr:glucose 1-dehydrogenase [Trueperaceae bacterium]